MESERYLSNYLGLEVGLIRRIQGIGYGVLEFLGVGTTFDIFQNIHILYLRYGVLSLSGYGVLEFLGVGTTFDIFQNIHILYLRYGVLTSSGYDVLSFIPLWSLVSAGTNTSLYLP
ncbi:hypothetical protein Tco_0042334 [Tanacetum coccineum]